MTTKLQGPILSRVMHRVEKLVITTATPSLIFSTPIDEDRVYEIECPFYQTSLNASYVYDFYHKGVKVATTSRIQILYANHTTAIAGTTITASHESNSIGTGSYCTRFYNLRKSLPKYLLNRN